MMAGGVGVFVEGDRRIEQKFDQFPQSVHSKLYGSISSIIARLAAKVRTSVPKRTGKLASEVHSEVKDSRDRITGVVGFSAEFAKAGALEYGGTGKPFKVRAHELRLDHVFANRLGSPLRVMVDAHSRPTHLIARRFERNSLEQMRAEIENDLRDVVEAAAAETVQ